MTKNELPKHVYRKPSGAVYFYRRGEKSIRIRSEIGTAEFAREYALAMQGTPVLNAGTKTFTNLIRSYQKTPGWEALAPRTKADYQAVLTYIEAKLGPHAADKFLHHHVIKAQLANRETVRFANYIVQVLRILFSHARALGWREDNPAKGVPALKSQTEGRTPWPPELVKKFREAAPFGDRARTVLELGIGTGQRPGDLVKMRWDDIKDGGIFVKQGKTGARLWIPITRALRDALDATPRRGLTICARPNGQPSTYRAVAVLVFNVRKLIGAEAYDLHSLRYTAAAELAAVGCSDELIQSITGHKTGAMVAQYAGAARQKSRAIEAMKRREG